MRTTLESGFSFALCPGSHHHPQFNNIRNEIYRCWDQVWNQVYEELSLSKRMFSDTFSRQDLIGSVFWQTECVAVAFFRWANADSPDFARDSYFENWNRDHLNSLTKYGKRIIVCSQFTVSSTARQKKLNVSVKDLLLGLIIQVFLNSEAHAMTGATRNDRGVNDLCIRWGADLIAKQVSGFDGDTDLFGFFKPTINSTPLPTTYELVKHLWNARLIIPKVSFDQRYADLEPILEVQPSVA